MKNVFYFPHDHGARNDEKIIALMDDYGAAGYGMFWTIVELLHEAEDSCIAYNDKRIKLIAKLIKMQPDELKKMLNDCIKEYELFYLKGGKLYSARVLKNRQKRDEMIGNKQKAGFASGEKRAKNKTANTNDTPAEQVLTVVEQNPTNKHTNTHTDNETNKEREGEDNFSAPAHADVLLADRVQLFRQEVNTYLHTYPQALLDGFFRYWSEPDQLNTYMKKDLERTWNTTSRLATWHHREARYGTSSPPANTPAKPAYDYLAERKALEERSRQFGKDLFL